MDKIIIKLHSIVDVITNSSSELFICNTKKTVDEVKNILEAILDVYNEASEEETDPIYSNEAFGKIEFAKEDGEDECGYGHSIKKGDLVIYSNGDNSIPYALFDFIDSVFNGRHYHLG